MRLANFGTLVMVMYGVVATAAATTHTFYYEVTALKANPDGVKEKTVIGFNNTWPLPTIEITKGDTVLLYLTNGLKDSNTSLHFHGLFQNGANAMDGPEFVTQCPIAPGQTYLYNFTVDSQSGTYWYHSHTGNQYLDGLRGALIIHDSEPMPFEYDEEVMLTISDWYHDSHKDLMKQFLNKYNPTGAEPVPQNALFNDSRNVTWEVKPNTTYFLRIASVSGFVSQYLYIEDHEMTVVEVDGVYVEPTTTKSLYLTAAQRYGVLIKTKEVNPNKNFCFMQALDESMLDIVPAELELTGTNWMVYNKDADLPESFDFDYTVEGNEPVDDFTLVPIGKYPLLPDYDYQIVLDVEMLNLANGVNYALFNNITYVPPKVPTLATVLSAPKDQIFNKEIYGSNTHSFVLQKDEIVEIVVNNHDDGKHPFHLHGHIFQVIQKSPEFEDPTDYDENDHESFPDYPLLRDTVQVAGNGYMVLRFKANNPGVWFFHCHVDWHLEQGLAITLIEDPETLRETQYLSDNFKEVCDAVGMGYQGNAAGNTKDYGNLDNENVQPSFLPPGFTAKGYFAMFLCVITALYGLYTIFSFGNEDDATLSEDEMIENLKNILIQNNAFDESLLGSE
ncbi:ferroxidase [Saccharomycopsis crataegensis]|uniref:Ferroxidase n=1 Tax=Saccharomycopsis crataegensis TaxID=43959 RepID=A0AAV5QQQ6_9ASCO|nr:ferroxidase [Saccharomycopsis crataegensis]